MIGWLLALPWVRRLALWLAAAGAFLTALAALRRSGERTGRLQEQLEQEREVSDARQRMLERVTGRIPSLVSMRDRMRQEGRASKTVVIAVARQLLVILNAMLRSATHLAARTNDTVAPRRAGATVTPCPFFATSDKFGPD